MITVEHAYDLLISEGYVNSKERSGYFICYTDSDMFPVHEEKTEPIPAPAAQDAIGFPSGVYARAVRRVLTDYEENILTRSPHRGNLQLRTSISKYLARSRGITVSPEQIIIGAGSEYLYSLIVQMLGRDRIYGIEDPSYAKIEQVYAANGVKYEMLKLGKDGIESRELKKSHASVLHVSPYRSYPSNVTASSSKKHEYLRWAQKNDAYVIEDDFESEFTLSRKSEDTLFSMDDSEKVIYVNTFTQTISSGLRTGYMIVPKKLLPLLEERIGFYSCTVSTFQQLVLSSLLDSGDFERHLNRVRRQKRKQQEM